LTIFIIPEILLAISLIFTGYFFSRQFSSNTKRFFYILFLILFSAFLIVAPFTIDRLDFIHDKVLNGACTNMPEEEFCSEICESKGYNPDKAIINEGLRLRGYYCVGEDKEVFCICKGFPKGFGFKENPGEFF
jgi:hypothetical protein